MGLDLLSVAAVLVRRSSKAIDEAATDLAVWGCRTAPDPGMGAPIELASGYTSGEGDLRTVGETLARVGRSAQEAPPALDQVEPTGGNRDEDLPDARVSRQPVADGPARVATQIVRDQIQVALRVVAVNGA